VYSGPIGAVLSPLLFGLDDHSHLPFASSLCYACNEVCSARIPLVDVLLQLRTEVVERRLEGRAWSLGFRGFSEASRHPRLWRQLLRLLTRVLPFAQQHPAPRWFGPLHSWTDSRALPEIRGKSFRQQWRDSRTLD
jgi:L-lactate dehydrogenase complex protein LldF